MTLSARFRLFGYVLLFAIRDIFPVSWYGRDLRERARTFLKSLRACVSTMLNLTTLAILVITTSLVAALYLGTVGWLRDYVESNPLARTVEVGAVFGTQSRVFKPRDLAELALLEIEGETEPVQGIFGWNDVTFWLFDAEGGKDDTLTHGRTVDVEDPVLDRLDYLAGRGRFTGDGVGQVIVSGSLLEGLGYAPGRLPERFQLDYSDLAAPLQVIGVVTDVPSGELMISESFYRAILDRQWDPLPRIPGFYLGPVEPTAQLEKMLGEIEPYLERRSATGELVRRNGMEQWLLFSRDEPWTRERWRQLFLPSIRRRLENLGQGWETLRLEWREPLASQVETRQNLEPEYTRASIYVRHLGQVPAVADAVAAKGLHITSNTREIALLFMQISSLGHGILLAVILVVGGLAAVSLVLSFSQDIRRKTPEIAILKAYGASDRLVLGAYTLEAMVLWAVATVFGLTAAGQLAGAVNRRLVALLQWQGDMPMLAERGLITMPMELKLTVALGALALCIGATWIAASVAARLQPAQALNLHR